MNRYDFVRSALMAATIGIAVPALAQDGTKAQFEARYAELRAAMQARDEAALSAILTPDYTMNDVQGETRTRADLLQRGGRMGGRGPGGGGRPEGAPPADGKRPDGPPPGAPRPERKMEQIVLSAKVTGEVATVDQQLSMSGSREGDDGKPHTMQMTMKATDVWVRQNGMWMLKASNQTEMSMVRDGEEVFSQKK